jgi:hypothetical protein
MDVKAVSGQQMDPPNIACLAKNICPDTFLSYFSEFSDLKFSIAPSRFLQSSMTQLISRIETFSIESMDHCVIPNPRKQPEFWDGRLGGNFWPMSGESEP